MAHDSRCENANTPPSDCDCECGGSKHGNGFAEQQIHDLQTDIDEIDRLKQLTPDEYFGEDAEGEELMAKAFKKIVDRISDTDNGNPELEQLRNDEKRLVDVADAKGMNYKNINRNGTPFMAKQTGARDYPYSNGPVQSVGPSNTENQERTFRIRKRIRSKLKEENPDLSDSKARKKAAEIDRENRDLKY